MGPAAFASRRRHADVQRHGRGILAAASLRSQRRWPSPTVPAAGLALILGVDRFLAEIRTATNFIGNGVAAIVISRWEKELDAERLAAELAGRAEPATPARWHKQAVCGSPCGPMAEQVAQRYARDPPAASTVPAGKVWRPVIVPL